MADLKILFADDQIPDDDIPDDQIRTVVKERHPEWSRGFINACAVMRQTVNSIKGAGYDVTVARTYDEVLRAMKDNRFDIAVVDLGWFGDSAIPPGKQEFFGYTICRDIDRVNENAGRKPTPQIVFSDRFLEYANLNIEAADDGRLPVCKNYDNPSVGQEALKAAVKFIETRLAERPIDELITEREKTFRRLYVDTLANSIQQQSQWSKLTLLFVALSVAILLVGAILTFFFDFEVDILASVSSILTTAISSLLFIQLRRSNKAAERNQERIEQEYKDSLQRIMKLLEEEKKD